LFKQSKVGIESTFDILHSSMYIKDPIILTSSWQLANHFKPHGCWVNMVPTGGQFSNSLVKNM